MSKRDEFDIERFKKGDRKDFEIIFKSYYLPLRYFAIKITTDELAAEDIVIGLFPKLWDRRDDFDTESNIRSFLYTSTKNRCIDYLDHKKVIRKAEKELADLSDWSVDDASFTQFAEADWLEQLDKEVRELPIKFSKVVIGIYFEKKTQRELADHFGVDERTIRNWLDSAKELLKERLSKHKKYALLLFFNLLDYLQ